MPVEVLERVRAELLDYRGLGLSVMEMSHRSDAFMEIADRAERNLREILSVGDDFNVLFLQGGATLQFAAVPLNLAEATDRVTYASSGTWSKKAIEEAQRYAEVTTRSVIGEGTSGLVDFVAGSRSKYAHVTSNETIEGIQFADFPNPSDVPLVADMSSDFLMRKLDVDRFDLIYAGAQKNVGPSGLTIVIVRKDLCDKARANCPLVMNYARQAEAGSMLNTPNTFAWYIAGLMFEWVLDRGGLGALEARSTRRAASIYAEIDRGSFYESDVPDSMRSKVNVTFKLRDSALDATFLAAVTEAGIQNLKGHRSVGGFRASLYNGIPDVAVNALADFMATFAQTYG